MNDIKLTGDKLSWLVLKLQNNIKLIASERKYESKKLNENSTKKFRLCNFPLLRNAKLNYPRLIEQDHINNVL